MNRISTIDTQIDTDDGKKSATVFLMDHKFIAMVVDNRLVFPTDDGIMGIRRCATNRPYRWIYECVEFCNGDFLKYFKGVVPLVINYNHVGLRRTPLEYSARHCGRYDPNLNVARALVLESRGPCVIIDHETIYYRMHTQVYGEWPVDEYKKCPIWQPTPEIQREFFFLSWENELHVVRTCLDDDNKTVGRSAKNDIFIIEKKSMRIFALMSQDDYPSYEDYILSADDEPEVTITDVRNLE